MFGYAVFNTFFMGFIIFIISNNSGNISAFNPISIAYISVNGIGFMAFIWFYGIHLVQNMFGAWVKDKERKNMEDKFV